VKVASLFDTVALSGGCFQNYILFEEVVRRFEQANFWCLRTRRFQPMTAAVSRSDRPQLALRD
jgi:hydrogenase maturation factor HypF (carbamoyltransferase family)